MASVPAETAKKVETIAAAVAAVKPAPVTSPVVEVKAAPVAAQKIVTPVAA